MCQYLLVKICHYQECSVYQLILWGVQIAYLKYKLNVAALGQRILGGWGEKSLVSFIVNKLISHIYFSLDVCVCIPV